MSRKDDTTEVAEAILPSYPEWRADAIHYLAEGDFYVADVVNKEWVVGKDE